jgi:hypothetical protein
LRLPDYIEKRNGVPLGASHSLRNMFYRSLGAGDFSTFWQYWNPIFSFCLGKYIFKPLKKILPQALSLILTFIFCGMLHDAVTILVSWNFTMLFTPWFLLMGLCVVISNYFKIDYSRYHWLSRAFINLLIIGSCFIIAFKYRI